MRTTRQAQRSGLGLVLGAWLFLLCACPAPKPEPTAEFLAVRPQRIAVVAAQPSGDALEVCVGEQVRAGLRMRGFETEDAGGPVDAELRYRLDERVAVRGDDGRQMVKVRVSGVLLSSIDVLPNGVLWEENGAFGQSFDPCLTPYTVVTPPGFRGEPVALSDPGLRERVEEAAFLVAQSLLRRFPERIAPKSSQAR